MVNSNHRCILKKLLRLAPVGLLLLAVSAPAARAMQWETLFTAQDVRDHLSTPAGREQALQFCRRMNITKVYLEVFRGYQAKRKNLVASRDFFRQHGLQVSGCVTTVHFGKISSARPIWVCFTSPKTQARLAQIFRYAASMFNEIMIDDFFCTDCNDSEAARAKGSLSWPQYRDKLMVEVSRKDVLGPARAVNPHVKVIIKFPQWYETFQNRGYVPAKETPLYDRIWVGTELRDPSSAKWGYVQQYRAFFLFRWLASIAGPKEGGGWFDPFATDRTLYMDQAYVTALTGAREVLLFHYGALTSDYRTQAETLEAHRRQVDQLARLAGGWKGIPAYKPPASDAGDEAYIFDRLGMLGIPLLPTAHFPARARVAVFANQALGDPDFVPQLDRFLARGGTAFVSQSLAHRLAGDPLLKPDNQTDLGKGNMVRTLAEGPGRMIVFADQLPHLADVSDQNQVTQLDPETRAGLRQLRGAVAKFVPTSLDAPPRVVIFPMRAGVAVANFTELPVTCSLTGAGSPQAHYTKVFGTSETRVTNNGKDLSLPGHGVMVVR